MRVRAAMTLPFLSPLVLPQCPLIYKIKVNVTYAAPAEGVNTQLPEGTQSMIGSYQVVGVAEFAKKMEEEGMLSLAAGVSFESKTINDCCRNLSR